MQNSADRDEFKIVDNYFSPKGHKNSETVNGIIAGDISHIYNYTQKKVKGGTK